MNSLTKIPVSDDQLEQIAQKYLGGPLQDSRELKDGWFNTAIFMKVDDAKYVLKIAPRPDVRVLRYEHNLMAAEVGAMRLVRGKTKVPVARVAAYDQSQEIVPSDFFVADCVPGIPLDHAKKALDPDALASIERQVGAYLYALHTVKGSGFGTFNLPTHTTWRAAFEDLLECLRKDQLDKEIELPTDAFGCTTPHLSSLNEVKESRLIHWDLWDPNVFVDPETAKVTGLIDFERALWADPLMEGNFRSPSPALLEGYGAPILDEPGSDARRALYALYLFLIMTIECTYRHFESDHEKMCRGLLDDSIEALKKL